ncbi:MAG TPA: hypothetical protein VIY86_06590 [Pirellulaceae bacterium]
MNRFNDSRRIYGYPNVGRYGLAHSLLSWGRCTVWTHRHGLPMLAPSWFYPRLGPYLRRDRDKRHYNRMFQFGHYVHGLRRLYLLGTMKRVDADQLDFHDIAGLPDGTLVEFKNQMAFQYNEGSHWTEIAEESALIRAAFQQMTKPRYRPPDLGPPHIAMHVRLGDGKTASVEDLKQGVRNKRLPLNWYHVMLRGLRERLGIAAPVRLYSDGYDTELADFLREPDLIRMQPLTAATDMLSIAQAAVFISSGSGFSFWGSFLGQVPRICFPGQRMLRVITTPSDIDLEPECETAADLNDGFLELIRNKLRGL